MLSIVGLGLDDGEITLKGLKALEEADKAYAEFYTNTKTIDPEKLEEKTGTEIEELSREQVEQDELPVKEAEEGNICFLVSGDPLTATTHYGIKHEAEKKGIEVEVVHAPSILTSVAETGLNVYKFGRVVTLPEEGEPESIVKMIEKNDSVGLHTLILLDIDYTANAAAEKLVNMNKSFENRECLVVQRANLKSQSITQTTFDELKNSKLGETPHCIILKGSVSHKEREFLDE